MFTQLAEPGIKPMLVSEEVLLLEGITKGDEKALCELYDRYSKIIYSLIIKIVKNHEEAEELLQSVFIKIWEKASKFDRTKGNVYSWIITLARNSAIDRIRSKEYKSNLNSMVEIEKADSFNLFPHEAGVDLMITKERSEMVNKALKVIPYEQSYVIELAYFEGMSQSEIAVKLSIPLGTVKTRMRQALIKLEKFLGPVI